MINLAVINLKVFLKKISKIILILIILCVIVNIAKCINIKEFNLFSSISFASTDNIEKNIIVAKYFDGSDKKEKSEIKKLLESELAIFSTTEEKLMEIENMEEVVDLENITGSSENEEKNAENKEIEENKDIETNIEKVEENKNIEINVEEIPDISNTRIINENNKTDKYTDVYKSVKIKNESKYTLTEEIVTPNFELTNKKDIIIFHTHTCESYTKTENTIYEESGNFRTINLNYNVAGVGTELSNILTNFGYNIIHSVEYHDYPAYTGSYSRSLSTVKKLLEKNKNAEFIIDLHRDALGSNSAYGPKVEINGEIAAQLMFVIGTDGGGLEHPNWKNNLKTAIKIQEKANEMYPGLFKPIILRNSRYNQHVTNGACIIEVGATGNTIDECKTSMKYLGKIISEIIK